MGSCSLEPLELMNLCGQRSVNIYRYLTTGLFLALVREG
jgi:hypothetical protein